MITRACIGDCMKRHAVVVTASTTVQEAARVVIEKHIGTLPVVDENGLLIGVVRLQDLLRVFMPDFVALLNNIDFVRDFGALEQVQPKDVSEASRLTVSDLAEAPVAVEEDSGLMHALTTIVKHQLQDLPIVDTAGRLVGIASRVDIAAAFFAPWIVEESSS